jgi:ketosteroid isomerase-like protein
MTTVTATTAVELGRAYLDALQAKDRDAILALLADDFALEVPCNISGSNDLSDSWYGLEAARANYDLTFRTINDLRYDELEYTPGAEDGVAFAEGLGVMTMFNGNPYRNRYVFRFDTAGGKIRRIREYLNPITSALAFGRALPQPAGADVCANGKTVLQAAQDWMDAAARYDVDELEATMADGCLRYGEPSWMVLGKADYIRAYRGFVKSFSDYKLQILNVMANGRQVVFEMIESATLSSPYVLPDGTVIQPTGDTYTDRCCTWLEVDESGLISEIRAYIPTTRGELMAKAIAASR